ncbi:MAG: lytic murein transglycosylase, partial [Bdellovibrionales bacterium]|nr:lytic murein transglycosylase [Bdellovibrionales bacterium]
LSETKIREAKNCLNAHRQHFQDAEKAFHVPKSVLASILLVETHCGKVTGKSVIFHRLSRLASVRDPQNIKENFKRLQRSDPSVKISDVENRAIYLENTFLPEVSALLQLARLLGYNIFGFRGSDSGAFGIPQFLPSSYLRFGVDGDNDNKVSLYTPADAIWSAANFLSHYGWDITQPPQANRNVLLKYNKSDPYVDTILALAKRIE